MVRSSLPQRGGEDCCPPLFPPFLGCWVDPPVSQLGGGQGQGRGRGQGRRRAVFLVACPRFKSSSSSSNPVFSLLQVLGREAPFPLILLPQFGGYWIEGTNHDLAEVPELQSPGCKVKLECNHLARVYRKHFLGKVSPRGREGEREGGGLGRKTTPLHNPAGTPAKRLL